jgi:hypothetical protein
MYMEYVLLTWTTAEGKRRRSFAVKPTSGKKIVCYALVTNDGDERNEKLIAYADDASVNVKPAVWNLTYAMLEKA